MSEPPLVSVIVITLNTPRMTASCLRSVVKNSSVPYELIVISNSRARPILRCLRRFPQARVIQNPENIGFSRAANQGMLAARGAYLCLLNSDAIVPPEWLERLVEAIRRPGVAAVGPASDELYDHPERKPWPFPIRPDNEKKTALIDREFRRRYRDRLVSVPDLHGFCLLLSRVVMDCIGLLDEGYFFGLEDLDYSLCLRLRGYQLLRVDSVFVHHQQGASSSPERRALLVRQAQAYFIWKWATPLERPEPDFPTLLRRLHKQAPIQRKIPDPLPARSPVILLRRERPRLVRRGFPVRARTESALVRLSNLEVFSSSPRMDRAWDFLQGGIDRRDLNGKSSALFRRQIDELIRPGLIGEIRPSRPPRCLVTVMMAAHQAERWIDQAIESVLAQRFRSFELIISDDGSLDRTGRIIRKYSWHPQIRLILNLIQRGVPAARNQILREARGRFIAICDSDDIALPDFLQRFVPFLQQHPRVGWVYADRMGIHSNGDRHDEFYPARPPDGKTEFRTNVIAHAGALIRREAMEGVGGYDESLLSTEDYDLALKIARKWEIAALPGEMHYLWRQHPQSHSRVAPWARRETDRLLRLAKRQRSRN